MQDEDFKKFLEEKRVWYKTIGTVFCPALNANVVFNAKGFYHFYYNSAGRKRMKKDQIARMELLNYVILGISSVSKIDKYQKRIEKGKIVEYWAIEYLLSRKWRVIIILRKIGSGKTIFYSTWKKEN